MPSAKDVKRTPSGKLNYRGETFPGFNKPKRTPKGPNMSIKKDIPARRKSFRARHNCASAKDKFSARYWSCKAW